MKNKLTAILVVALLSSTTAKALTLSDSLKQMAPRSNNDRQSQTYVTPQLEVCQSNYDALNGTSQLCGNSLNSNFSSLNNTDAWAAARGVLESASRLPGVYQNLRAVEWNKKLDQAANQAKSNVKTLGQEFADFKTGLKTYQDQALAPAVAESIHELQKNIPLVQTMQTSLQSYPEVPPQTSMPDYSSLLQSGLQASVSARALPATSGWVKDLSSAEANGNIAEVVNHLDAVQGVLKDPATAGLGVDDQAVLAQAAHEWIADDGIVSSRHLSSSGKTIRDSVSAQVKTAPDSREGQAVRHELNRGLLSLGSPNSGILADSEKTALTWGAMALALGADQAYQGGSPEAGRELLQHAAETLDFTLGLVPILGSANDIVQIIHGMVTGYDYTGHRMTTADYSLRAAGAVLGLLPVGSQFFKIGSQVITESFLEGARLIRNSGSGEALATALRDAPELAPRVAEGIGAVLANAAEAEGIPLVRDAVQEIQTLVRTSGNEAVAKLSEVLADSRIEADDRLEIIKSFIPESIRYKITEEAMIVFRWHNGDGVVQQIARYVSTELTTDPDAARRLLAIPEGNQMLFLDKYVVQRGAVIFDGITAEGFGLPGGGTQTFITGDLSENLKFIERMISR